MDKFLDVINKAKNACECSKNITENHFSQVGNMVLIGSSAKRKIMDYQLSRYACYLIAQKRKACDTHYEVGRKVRKTIEDIGGTMPEELPTPNKSIKQIEKDSAKIITGGSNELL